MYSKIHRHSTGQRYVLGALTALSHFPYSWSIDISLRYGTCRRSMDPDHFSEKLVSWRACHMPGGFNISWTKMLSSPFPSPIWPSASSYEMEASSSSRKLTPHTPHETPVEESGSYWQTSGEQSSTSTAIQVEGSNHSLVGNRDERKVWIWIKYWFHELHNIAQNPDDAKGAGGQSQPDSTETVSKVCVWVCKLRLLRVMLNDNQR